MHADLPRLLHADERWLPPVFEARHGHGGLTAERIERLTAQQVEHDLGFAFPTLAQRERGQAGAPRRLRRGLRPGGLGCAFRFIRISHRIHSAFGFTVPCPRKWVAIYDYLEVHDPPGSLAQRIGAERANALPEHVSEGDFVVKLTDRLLRIRRSQPGTTTGCAAAGAHRRIQGRPGDARASSPGTGGEAIISGENKAVFLSDASQDPEARGKPPP